MVREYENIQAQECKKLSNGLRILKQEVDKSKRILYELQDIGKENTIS